MNVLVSILAAKDGVEGASERVESIMNKYTQQMKELVRLIETEEAPRHRLYRLVSRLKLNAATNPSELGYDDIERLIQALRED